MSVSSQVFKDFLPFRIAFVFFVALFFSMAAVAEAIEAELRPVSSANDDRQYRYFVLANDLRVLLVSDVKTDKAAASMDVNVGSGDDPKERAGLAHFLEHMLFLGTEKYPEPGEYQSFISSHGGSHNAYTSSEHTNYFFDVDAPHLEATLDRFSQFFIAPLFTEKYVDRERNAVHSEYKAKIKNAYRRELDVYRQIVSPRHPMSKFSVGSLETLADRPDDPVQDDLLDFYRDYYSANNMTLVVLGRESLDQLQSMVEARFSSVETRETKTLSSSHELFRPNFLPARVSIKPVKDERRLSLVFPIPSADKYYKEKPLSYLGSILGHEGKGSLLSLLKELGWAEGLSAGSGLGGRNQGTFNISIQLTPEGFDNQPKVVATVFRMIQNISKTGIEQWRFDEQKSLSEMAFRFSEKGEPMGVVSRLSNQMHRYPVEDIIRGGYAYDEFDARLIRRYLKYLAPDNLLWVVTSPDVDVDKQSRLYSTPYGVERLRYEVASIAKVHLDKLKLPERNGFIPNRLQVKQPPAMESVSALPQLIRESEGVEVWFKQDTQFNVPRATINIRAYSPAVGQTVRSAAMAHLYAALVNDRLNEFAYPAALAGLNFNVSANSRGMDVSVSGYNDRQGLLLNRMLSTLDRGRFENDRFESIQKELIRNWRNQVSLTPYKQLFRKLPVLLYSPFWDELEMAQALESVTAVDLRRFGESLWQGSRVQALVHGNLYRQEALKLATLITYKLHEPNEVGFSLPQAQVLKLGQDVHHYHLPVDHRDVAAVFYQQAKDASVEDRAHMMMVRQLLRAPFFHQLRTEKQLGYIVFGSSMGLKDVAGNVFVVQSPSAPLPEVMSAIQSFLVQTVTNVDNFEQQRQALLSGLLESPKNLQEQSARYWSELLAQNTDFERRKTLISAVEALTPESVAAYGVSSLGADRGVWLTAGDQGSLESLSEFPAATSDVNSLKNNAPSFKFP